MEANFIYILAIRPKTFVSRIITLNLSKNRNFVLAEEISQTSICNEQIGEVGVYLTIYNSKVCIKRLVSSEVTVS